LFKKLFGDAALALEALRDEDERAKRKIHYEVLSRALYLANWSKKHEFIPKGHSFGELVDKSVAMVLDLKLSDEFLDRWGKSAGDVAALGWSGKTWVECLLLDTYTAEQMTLLLPHVVFAVMHRDHPSEFKKKLLGPPRAPRSFWEALGKRSASHSQSEIFEVSPKALQAAGEQATRDLLSANDRQAYVAAAPSAEVLAKAGASKTEGAAETRSACQMARPECPLHRCMCKHGGLRCVHRRMLNSLHRRLAAGRYIFLCDECDRGAIVDNVLISLCHCDCEGCRLMDIVPQHIDW